MYGLTFAGISLFELIISIYGGYFGGGIGILMLASLGLMGMENIHEMNAMKTLLATLINGVAVVIFILRGVVAWPQTIVMVIGAIIGGYAGAYYARKIDQRWIRGFVILVGISMTIYFFVRGEKGLCSAQILAAHRSWQHTDPGSAQGTGKPRPYTLQ